MKVASTRLSDETMAALSERATSQNVSIGEIMRIAIEYYLAVADRGDLPVSRTMDDERLPPIGDCEHPRSRILQLPAGVLCDRCGTWLKAGMIR